MSPSGRERTNLLFFLFLFFPARAANGGILSFSSSQTLRKQKAQRGFPFVTGLTLDTTWARATAGKSLRLEISTVRLLYSPDPPGAKNEKVRDSTQRTNGSVQESKREKDR